MSVLWQVQLFQVTWGDPDMGGDSSHVQDQLAEAASSRIGVLFVLAFDGLKLHDNDPR